jgi:hypothetical protein
MGFAKQIDDAPKNADLLDRWVQGANGSQPDGIPVDQPDGRPVRISPTNSTRLSPDVAPLPGDETKQTQKRPLTRLILALVSAIVCIGLFAKLGSLSRPIEGSNTSEIAGSMPTPQSRGNVTAGEQTPSDARQTMRTLRDGSRDQTDPQPARPQTPRAMSSDEEAKLVARAEFLIKQFDFASARLLLAYALEKGSARAAFMMAETYDWQILRSLQAYGVRGDDQRAREFYQLAAAAGIEKARERAEALQPSANSDARLGGR